MNRNSEKLRIALESTNFWRRRRREGGREGGIFSGLLTSVYLDDSFASEVDAPRGSVFTGLRNGAAVVAPATAARLLPSRFGARR
jgi:hypothetical protein